jgi:5'-3' exonuclease
MTNPALGIDSMIGMALHLILNSMKKEYVKWNGTHVVFYLEGRSWRKDFYPGYKANRKVAFAQQTPKEQEDHHILVDAFDDFVEYLDQKTNITVLQNPRAEADDMIAIFIDAHPDDKHVLISSDSDFFQLLRYPNLVIYDPVKDILIKQDGVYDDDGNKLEFVVSTEAKIKAGKKNPDFVCDPDWFNYALFTKCIRGDKTDNIFSAYPGVREKGTKTTVGIREAYTDRGNKGFAWNNFMLQKWVDENKDEQRVKEKYEFNRTLIDLGQIPEDVKISCLEVIAEQTGRKSVPAMDIGTGFMKFCGKWALKKIGDSANSFMPMLKAKY